MAKNVAIVMVAAILGIVAIACTCIARGVDTTVATASVGALGTVLGVGGGIIIGRKGKG
ncbi:unnamed protein product [marine sediment metagenome]|uniref:Uncharacterized protein n=1 Tax=marine sediment metagenome TaxID=412755 RepID=X1NDY5_9ZZZZ